MYDFYDSEIVKKFHLSEESVAKERKIIESNKREISEFQKKKLIEEGRKNWDKFYNHYRRNFFKDRNWVHVEFEYIFENAKKDKQIAEREEAQKNDTNNKDVCILSEKNKCNIITDETNSNEEKKIILEMGCGVGNTLIPLMMKYDNYDFIGIDFSKNALILLNEKWKELTEMNKQLEKENIAEAPEEPMTYDESYERKKHSSVLLLLKEEEEKEEEKVAGKVEKNAFDKYDVNENGVVKQTRANYQRNGELNISDEAYSESENTNEKENFQLKKYRKFGSLIKTYVMDIAEEETQIDIYEFEKVDIILLIFVLSSIHPEKMQNVINRSYKYLKKGGHVILRDYGLYDLSQVRFANKKKKKMSENFYVRGDKTFVYFFKTEELHNLFCKENLFKEVENKYITRIVKNRKRNIEMKRVWVQAVFRKI